MPIQLQHLVADRKAVAVDFGDAGTMQVEYYPRKLTAGMLAAYAAADQAKLAGADPDKAVAVMGGAVDTLMVLLASWDLVDGETPLPIDRPTLDGVGLVVQWAILNAIMVDGGKGEASAPVASQSAQPSGATSSPTAG